MLSLLCDYDADIEARDASVPLSLSLFLLYLSLYSSICVLFVDLLLSSLSLFSYQSVYILHPYSSSHAYTCLLVFKGNTALHVSAARDSSGTLTFLLEYAAQVNAQNDVGDTPLHLAVWFGNYESVKMLLEYSAPVALLNSYGLNAYFNVMERSPLVKKQKLPSGLRRSLKLLSKWMPAPLQQSTANVAASSGGGGGGDDEFHDCDETTPGSPSRTPIIDSMSRTPPPPDVLRAMRQMKVDPRLASSQLAPPPDVEAAIQAAKRSIQGGGHDMANRKLF